MLFARQISVGLVLLGGLHWQASAAAQDLALSKDCEAGFRRLIQMAEGGQLGDDVTNANVGVFKNWARVELVVRDAAPRVLLLTPKRSTRSFSRYFDVAPGDGATASDVRRLGAALDEAFQTDPFQLAVLEESSATSGPIPSFVEAWAIGGGRGVARALERRMMAQVSLEYTAGVSVAVAIGLLASLLLLWTSLPSETED